MARRKIVNLDSAYKDVENTELEIKNSLSSIPDDYQYVQKDDLEKQISEAENDAYFSYTRIRRILTDKYNSLVVSI